MNKLLVSILLSTFAFAASAQTVSADATAQAQDKSADVTVITGDKSLNDRHCMRETGSHIVGRHRKACLAADGRAYTREDIDVTGAVDLADALRRLDPSVRITHN